MHMWFLKKPSSSVTGIPLRSVLVNMDIINHTFPYSNRRIPEHVNFVAMTQSLKRYLAKELWLITSQTKDNLAVFCSEIGFTIKQVFQMCFLLCPKNKHTAGLIWKNGNHRQCPNRIINEEIKPNIKGRKSATNNFCDGNRRKSGKNHLLRPMQCPSKGYSEISICLG